MAEYKVKSRIQHGEKNDKGEVEIMDYPAGSTIELEDADAYSLRHALEDGPEDAPAEDGDEELTEEEEEAVKSIRNRPDNAESGVLLHWKTDAHAQALAEDAHLAAQQGEEGSTADVGKGFERAHVAPGHLGLSTPLSTQRPKANETVMEKEDREIFDEHMASVAKERKKPASRQPKKTAPKPDGSSAAHG